MRALRYPILAALAALALSACLPGMGAPTAAEGECLQVGQLGTEVEELPKVDCSEEHDAEVYSVFDVEYEGDYDEAAILAEVEDACVSGFNEFVGVDYYESELDIYYLYPLADGWSTGDREAICAVTSPDWDSETGELQMVTGSLEGANR